MCFESFEEAKLRHQEQGEYQNLTANSKRSPVGNFKDMDWDQQVLLEEVEDYTNGTIVNWSGLARRYQVKNKNDQLAKNGEQIVQ